MTTPIWGATPAAWSHFEFILGVGEDLLPTVSNPGATISPVSKMRSLGKTPSRYNKDGLVAGIVDWTQRKVTSAEIAKWSRQPDYGICLQTRTVRALDCDITDPALAEEIYNEIVRLLGGHVPPVRRRANSPKFLVPIKIEGPQQKRTIKTNSGIIELLGDGQQFIACGTHPSGARYEWANGLPYDFPELTAEQFEALWARLVARFSIDGTSTTSSSRVRESKLADATNNAAAANDPTTIALHAAGVVLSAERDGRLHITCPWEDEHTEGTGGESATTYFPAGTNDYQLGHFHCLHASHADKSDSDFLTAIGIAPDMADDYEAVEAGTIIADDVIKGSAETGVNKYVAQSLEELFARPRPGWKIKEVMPAAAVGFIYGDFGSGKTFLALDIAFAIAQGIPWRGYKTKQGTVVYLAAEDAAGVVLRAEAYKIKNGLVGVPVPLLVIDASPNLTSKVEKNEVFKAIKAAGDVSVVFIDTTAAVMAGANENSGEDMGLLLDYCKALHRKTGAMVVLVAHVGKDVSKGIRGWSGMGGAADFMMLVDRPNDDDDRVAKVKKLKNSKDGGEFGFKLETVSVDTDEDGDLISSCVVEHCAAVPHKPKPKALSEYQRILYAVAEEMQRLDGTFPEASDVIEAAVEKTVYDPDVKNDTRKARMKRALYDLVEMGKLRFEGSGIAIGEAE